jgi:phosphomannomutase
LLAHFLTQRGLKGVVGKTVATSGFVNAVAEYLGLDIIETPVGFKWFVEKAVNDKVEFLVAGEESAHVGVGPFMKSWDDGIATGNTAFAAIMSVRSQGPESVIVAVPVAPSETVERLSQIADRVICLRSPEPFYAIGQFYADFRQVEDDEVIGILKTAQSPAGKSKDLNKKGAQS